MLEDLILAYLKYRAVRCSLAEITQGINDKEKQRVETHPLSGKPQPFERAEVQHCLTRLKDRGKVQVAMTDTGIPFYAAIKEEEDAPTPTPGKGKGKRKQGVSTVKPGAQEIAGITEVTMFRIGTRTFNTREEAERYQVLSDERLEEFLNDTGTSLRHKGIAARHIRNYLIWIARQETSP